MKTDELRDSRWILEPEFLWKEEGKWLNNNEHTLKNDDPEVKKSVTIATSLVDQRKATLHSGREDRAFLRLVQSAASGSTLFKVHPETKEMREQRTK